MEFELRPYQEQSVLNVENTLSNGKRSALVVLATGCGKTIVFSSIIENEVSRGGRVLVLAHRNKLLEQAHDKLLASCGIDAHYDGKKGGNDKVVISSVQAMSRDTRLENYPDGYFSMIVVDETHHIASPSYKKIVDHFSSAKIVGVTATPVRGDHKDVSEMFDETCYEYNMLDAINDGYLSPLHIKKCPIEIDISGVHLQSGDYAPGELGEALDPYLIKIVKEIKRVANDRKTIVFVPLVSTAKKLSAIFNDEGFRSEYVSGERKESDNILKDFENGDYNVIVNACLLTEGYDCPSIDCVVNLRPTKSESLYLQIIGRGTRLSQGKENCLILDFLWQDNGRGQLNAQDVVLNETPEMKMVMEKIARRGEELDLLELQKKAKDSLVEEREKALAEAIRRANEATLQKQKEDSEKASLKRYLYDYAVKKSSSTGKPINSINAVIRPNKNTMVLYNCASGELLKAKTNNKTLHILDLAEYEPMYSSDAEKPTNGQLDLISKFGIPLDFVICKGHAGDIITTMLSRKNRGLSSYKQIDLLSKRGFNNVQFYSSHECEAIIQSLKRHNWSISAETRELERQIDRAIERNM